MRNLPLLGLLAIALLGCKDGKDDGPDTGLDSVDIDGDGYSVLVDCDDEDAAVNPGADEVCDGKDNNCDELIDNDPVDGGTYLRDGDGDGYGDDTRAVVSCEAVEDHVLQGGDCNDGRDDIFPGAPEDDCTDPVDYNCDGSVGYADADGDGFAACEDCNDAEAAINDDAAEICDELDNDCDGRVDDADPEVTGAPTWYQDRDADTYGTSDFTTEACEQPSGFVDNAEDCDDLDAAINPDTSWYSDSDGDGYGDPQSAQQSCVQPAGTVLDDQDCDDTDAAINPETLWFIDADRDGYGEGSAYTTSCEQPVGYAASPSDCDDGDASVNPGAAELCSPSGGDEDCDGQVDESGATDAADWFADADRDGFGDAAASTPSCLQPTGYVSDSSDCDDTSAEVNPDAFEICNDGIDNDCSGGLEECVLDLEDADLIIEGPTTNASGGGQISAAGDVTGDGVDDLWISAYLEDASGAESGATYLFEGPLGTGTLDMAADSFARLVGEADDRSGQSISGGFDVSGDSLGVPDLLVSGHRNNGDQPNRAGVTYLIFGENVSAGDIDLTSDADVTFIGEVSWDRLGLASEMVGDVVGDANNDVAIGSPFRNDNGRTDNGAVYVAAGPFASGTYDIEDAELILEGESDNDQVGTRLAAGDLDGDGVNELIIGAQLQDAAGASAGAVYIVDGNTTGRLDLADHASLGSVTKLDGETGSDNAGQTIATGDLTGDGLSDLLVAAPGDDDGGVNAGAVYILTGATIASASSLATWDSKVLGRAGETIGAGLSGAGDVDGDSLSDLLVGSTALGANGEGGAFLLYGPLSNSTYDLSAEADVTFLGESVNDGAGSEVDLILDMNGAGDGRYDIFIGSATSDRNGTDSGSVYGIFSIGL